MTFKKNGVVSKESIPFEADNVFRVTGSDTFTVLVDDEEVITFSFSGATFEPKAEEDSRCFYDVFGFRKREDIYPGRVAGHDR